MFRDDSIKEGTSQTPAKGDQGAFFFVREIGVAAGKGGQVEYQFEMSFAEAHFAFTKNFPSLPEQLLSLFPDLAKHRCDNNKSASFSHELFDTETAHVFEHLVAEHLALEGFSRRSIGGKTGWRKDGDPRGPYLIFIQTEAQEGILRVCVQKAEQVLKQTLSLPS